MILKSTSSVDHIFTGKIVAMESPHKRLKQSPPDSAEAEAEADFVSLSVEEDPAADQYGYNQLNGVTNEAEPSFNAPRAPRSMYPQQHSRNARNDPRHARDKPKSKHILPGYEPWILVKTKYGRRFVHNQETKESLWRFPSDVVDGVREFDALERQQREKDKNSKWAEEQLRRMRAEQTQQATGAAEKRGDVGSGRRRRSESLQREDEEVLMAELAAEAEEAEEADVRETVKAVESLKPRGVEGGDEGDGSESEYEVIEVTDSEFEDEDDAEPAPRAGAPEGNAETHDGGAMEFGEDDIAYQLAAMEQEHNDEVEDEDEDQQQNDYEEEEEDAEDEANEGEAAATFREMLDDHDISPFTPWDKLIGDESDNSIIMDHRYTVLPNMRTRKAVWESWVKDTASRLKEERAKAEVQDPKVPYLAFLAEKASPKLYWPEFKRKYRKESALNHRKLSERDRERLYRDHINRLKLPERTRKADLITLLKSIPRKDLNKSSTLQSLPQQLMSHLHFISLPTPLRDQTTASHISGLPAPSEETEGDHEDGDLTAEQRSALTKSEGERRKEEEALRARAKQVEEDRRKAEKAERFAKRDLRAEEQELRRAMEVRRGGLKGQLGQ